MEKQIELQFGAMSEPIKQQLNKQGFDFNSAVIRWYQKMADCYLMLRINDFLTDEQAE